ncbi:MAG: thioredoxin, partial [Crenarchaeota archaeon]|nr:thioredoxin [Thermoproteota archaeon]
MKRTVIFLMAALFLVSCSNKKQEQTQVKEEIQQDGIEVLYFHGKQRCKSCVSIELRTKEMLNTYFSQEMKKGKIIFKTIDFSLKENEPIADKYEIAWSSLLLIKHQNGDETVKNLTDFGFSYAYKNPETFIEGMKEEID